MRHRPSQEEIMEIGDLGHEIYEREIESRLTEADHGKVIAIDVDTGDWVIGIEGLRAMDAENPDARIYNAVHTVEPTMGFGGASFFDEPENVTLDSGR